MKNGSRDRFDRSATRSPPMWGRYRAIGKREILDVRPSKSCRIAIAPILK
jgi:hypothetical protein